MGVMGRRLARDRRTDLLYEEAPYLFQFKVFDVGSK